MKSVERSALVPHPSARLYALVADIESYPQFLPWCSTATIQVREPHCVEATIGIDFRGIRQSFTARNTLEAEQAITIALVRGPFRSLNGLWRFRELAPAACKVELQMRYEFASALLERLAGPVFNHIAITLVDAFIRRADSLYAGEGAR